MSIAVKQVGKKPETNVALVKDEAFEQFSRKFDLLTVLYDGRPGVLM